MGEIEVAKNIERILWYYTKTPEIEILFTFSSTIKVENVVINEREPRITFIVDDWLSGKAKHKVLIRIKNKNIESTKNKMKIRIDSLGFKLDKRGENEYQLPINCEFDLTFNNKDTMNISDTLTGRILKILNDKSDELSSSKLKEKFKKVKFKLFLNKKNCLIDSDIKPIPDPQIRFHYNLLINTMKVRAI